MKFSAIALLAAAQILSAGALTLEIGNSQANAEAKALHAIATARVTACHEPGKSVVHASLVRKDGGSITRTPLQVTPLSTPGLFAIISKDASVGLLELTVTNPEYQNYEPRVLVRVNAEGPEWGSLKRYYSKPPAEEEVMAALKP